MKILGFLLASPSRCVAVILLLIPFNGVAFYSRSSALISTLAIMSDLSSGIPVMRSPVDEMETGPNGSNLAAAAKRNHYVQELQSTQSRQNRGFLDLDGVRRLYGSGLAMTLATERQLASRNGGRLPGMTESKLLMDTITGKDISLDFDDFLSKPEHNPIATIKDPHSAMQRKLGL